MLPLMLNWALPAVWISTAGLPLTAAVTVVGPFKVTCEFVTMIPGVAPDAVLVVIVLVPVAMVVPP